MVELEVASFPRSDLVQVLVVRLKHKDQGIPCSSMYCSALQSHRASMYRGTSMSILCVVPGTSVPEACRCVVVPLWSHRGRPAGRKEGHLPEGRPRPRPRPLPRAMTLLVSHRLCSCREEASRETGRSEGSRVASCFPSPTHPSAHKHIRIRTRQSQRWYEGLVYDE